MSTFKPTGRFKRKRTDKPKTRTITIPTVPMSDLERSYYTNLAYMALHTLGLHIHHREQE